MSILLSDQDRISCKIHQNEFCYAADLNTKGKQEVNFLCIKCLVEQQSNQQITLIEDTKKLINQMKSQKVEKQSKENEVRRETFKNLLSQIKECKLAIDLSFEKITSSLQQRLFYIQKDIESLQFEGKNNYFEDLTELSQIYSQEVIYDQKKIQEDSKVIDELQKQFEAIFSTPQYLQLQQTIKNTKSLINEVNEDFIIFETVKITNDKKTPSLNKICKTHNKEIIMFEIESNKEVEDRFMCIDCMKDNPKKYKTIQDLNEQWTTFNSEQDKILQKLKKKKIDQSSKLQTQLKEIRRNFNSQLNDLEDTLLKEQIESNNQINEIKKKINCSTIYELNDDDLLEAMKMLNKTEKSQAFDTRLIEYQNGKDQLYFQDIENKLENLKQHNILDIQQSKNILMENTNDCNELKQLSEMIMMLIQQSQSNQYNKANLDEINKDLNDFIKNTKQYECHMDQFKITLKFYQEFIAKIEPLRNKLLSLTHQNQDENDYINLLDKHIEKFKKMSVKLQKFSEIEKYREEVQEEIGKIKQFEAEQNRKIKVFEDKLTDQERQFNETQQENLKLKNENQLLIQQMDALISYENQLKQLLIFGQNQAKEFENIQQSFQKLETQGEQNLLSQLSKTEFKKFLNQFQVVESFFKEKEKERLEKERLEKEKYTQQNYQIILIDCDHLNKISQNLNLNNQKFLFGKISIQSEER